MLSVPELAKSLVTRTHDFARFGLSSGYPIRRIGQLPAFAAPGVAHFWLLPCGSPSDLWSGVQ